MSMIDRLIEVVIRILAWGFQIGCVLLLAALLTAVVIWGVEEITRKRRGKFLPRFLVMTLLLCVILAAFALEPPVNCPDQYEDYLTDELREAVQEGGNGLYNWNIPLVPVCIEVTGVNDFVKEGKMEYSVEYTVYYFCWGSMEMSYSTCDGYSANSLFE